MQILFACIFYCLLSKLIDFSADENFDARFEVNFVVKHTGDVMHTPPAIVKSSCTIDITWQVSFITD
jgi:hypothetical protein